ncbi:MAG: hypothetical protein K2H22_07650 [Muribaculaceae bacterium]|nr:hypothetical protein [Muribaculaceae bacterium]
MKPANGRIIKNTGLLYFRLIFLTFINLYAVRVTLEALGDIDYGTYNVIASVVASLSILTGAMTSATQRFLSVHLGRKDYEEYSRTFSLLLICFIGMTVIILIIGEPVGLLAIHKWLKFPPDRINAVYWVFQTSLAAFAFGLITIPYTSSIVANEKMHAFALFSIVEGVLKLAIAFLLIHYGGDRLILYSILTMLISVVVLIMSMQYCHVSFKYCKYNWKWDKSIFTQLSQYTGWNLFGSVSSILATQGQNILLNIFFGPIINTSKAIADRIQHVINGFSVNLYLAASPQIIKSYAAEDYERALNLVTKTSKMSFLLILVLSFPLLCNMDGLLNIWILRSTETPDMVVFSKLILLYCLALSLEPPISRIIQATGDIKRYQVNVGIITLSFIPVAAFSLWLGASAPTTLIIQIIVLIVAQVVRVVIAHGQVGLSYRIYAKEVAVPIIKTTAVAVPSYIFLENLSLASSGLWMTILNTVVAGVWGLAICSLVGLNRNDRTMLMGMIMTKIKRSHH